MYDGPVDADWMVHAACEGKAALFFPPNTGVGQCSSWEPGPALAVCRGCPVRLACGAYAVGIGEITKDRFGWHAPNGGVWAGVAPRATGRSGKPTGRPVDQRQSTG